MLARRLSAILFSNAATSAFRNAAKAANVHTVRCSSILTRICRSSTFDGPILKQSHAFSKTCTCGIHHKLTEGDRDLANFLEQEIDYEKESMQDLPKLKDFKVNLDGSMVTLTRKHNGEKIVVSFDINENVNIDEAYNEEDVDADDEERISHIVSYPSFKVQIIKDSGKTLQLSCVYNTPLGDQEEEEDVDGEESIPDVFRFDDVAVLPHPDAQLDGEHVYEAETENMDGDLYKMLVNTLYERGVNNDFAQDLLDISTTVEHKQYVNFLQDLKSFFSAKH